MLFIVEGMDRVGKSTMCEALQRVYGGTVMHFSAPKKGALEEYVEPLIDYRPRSTVNIFVDRHFLGEAVWPEFFGRKSRMTEMERYCIESFLKSKGAMCVLMTRNPVELERACTVGKEPSAGRADEAQRMFIDAASYYLPRPESTSPNTVDIVNPRRLLHWWMHDHTSRLESLVERARELEKNAK